MAELGRWTIFSLLSPEFGQQIKFALAFGSSGNEALLVTTQDLVYGIGTNSCSCLGLYNDGFGGIGNGQSCLEPTKVNQLSGRQLCSMAFGSGPHVVALTTDGEVFSWGHNSHGQLGSGNNNPGIAPGKISAALAGLRVTQVACGSFHSAFVTDRGDVFTCGQNGCGQLGHGNNVSQPAVRKVAHSLQNRFVKAVACGQSSTMAITTSGELYSWGSNSNGQLGLGNNANQMSPCRVLELQNVVISQIVCGFAHCLAVTDEGELFAWGSNSCGQLGSNGRNNQLIPAKSVENLGRIIEAAAVHACNISAVVTQGGKVFMWGQVRGQSVAVPQETRFSNSDDVFACFATPPVSWRPIAFCLYLFLSFLTHMCGASSCLTSLT